MKGRASKRIRAAKFRTKILLTIAFVTLIPTSFLTFLFYKQVTTERDNQIYAMDLAFDQNVYSLSRSMEAEIANALQVSTNSEIVDFFSSRSTTREYVIDYVTRIKPLLGYIQETSSSQLTAIRFYTKNTALFSNLTVQNIYRMGKTAMFNDVCEKLDGKSTAVILSSEGSKFFSTEYAPKGTLYIYCLVSAPSFGKTIAECQLSVDSYFDSLRISTEDFELDNYTLVHSSGEIIFTSDPEWAQGHAAAIAARCASGEDIRNEHTVYNNQRLFINAAEIPSIDSVLICHSDMNAIYESSHRLIFISVAMVLACVGLSSLVAAGLVKGLLRRTDTINEAIYQIEEGDFDVSLDVQGGDFLDQVAENLNSMAAQIKNLIENDYENQLQIKDLHIKMLSQQISPHFLYNTLECLRMKAELEDNEETAQALTSLGRLLRYYASYYTETSSLGEELDVMRDYVNIMDLIEGRSCVFETEVPEELLGCSVPRFILQPLIENSIKHGSKSYTSEIHVMVSVEERDGAMWFNVTDDGVGVTPSEVLRIQEKLSSGETGVNTSRSIGLYNTDARITLLFGEEYGIKFSSVQGLGTSVTFGIPISLEDGPSSEEDKA